MSALPSAMLLWKPTGAAIIFRLSSCWRRWPGSFWRGPFRVVARLAVGALMLSYVPWVARKPSPTDPLGLARADVDSVLVVPRDDLTFANAADLA